MLDANLLKKGERFDQLPETYVVFITENDVLGKGLPLYRVERYIVETGEFFEDGAHILYVNGAYRDDTPLGKLMHDFSCTDPSEMYYSELAERVRFFKESKEGVATMSRVIEEMRRAEREEGRMEGRIEGIKTMALRILEDGKYALDEIAELSGLSLDDVRALQAEQNA